MTYKRPGVESKEIQISNLVTIAGGLQVPGVVGTGTNYINITDDDVTRGSGSSDTLPDTVSGDLLEMVRVGSLPGLSDYVKGTDYYTSDNTVVWMGTSNNPTAGDTYYVTYKKTKPASYYDAQTFYDIDDARAVWGYEMINGAINPITLVAKMLFDGGASVVVGVQQADTQYASFTAAVDKMKKEDIDILLCPGITSGDTFTTYAINHVNQMSSILEGKERLLMIGATLASASVTKIKADVPSDNELITYSAPPQVETTIHDYGTELDETKWVDVQYAAANLAGVMCDPSYDVAEPMLRKTLPNISGITNYLRSEADSLASSGVLVLEQKGSVVQVRHDLTTYVGDSAKEQISVVRIKHYVQKNWRTLLDKYIGKKNTPETLQGILGDSSAYLTNLLSEPKILNGFRALKAEVDSAEARRIIVYAEIAPIFPLCWIRIEFGIYVA